MKSKKKSLILVSSFAIFTVLLVFVFLSVPKTKVDYEPFAFSGEEVDINVVEPAKIMEGTKDGDLMIADPEGSEIFAKGGLNYVILGDGSNEVYYSLCSTKIINKEVNVIEGFDPKKDKLKIFCAHHKITEKDISIIHDRVEGEEVTYIQVQGKHSLTAIALLGNINISVGDIILNEKWPHSKK